MRCACRQLTDQDDTKILFERVTEMYYLTSIETLEGVHACRTPLFLMTKSAPYYRHLRFRDTLT